MAKRGPKPKKELDPFRRPDGTVDYTLARTVRRQEQKAKRRKIAEENRDLIFEKGTQVEYLICPVCLRRVPLWVKFTPPAIPVRRHERGIALATWTGPEGYIYQRMFTGPPLDYRPVVPYYFYSKYGSLPRPEEGLTLQQFYKKHNRVYCHHAEVMRKVHELFPSSF